MGRIRESGVVFLLKKHLSASLGEIVINPAATCQVYIKYNRPGIVCFILFRQKTLDFLTQMERYIKYLIM
jgi:hypothetical protein